MSQPPRLEISPRLLAQIYAQGEQAYPEEGAGLLLGAVDGDRRQVLEILGIANSREADARRNRYLLTAEDMLRGENEAARRGLDVIGVFHSHPDHPNRPSGYDLEWALPWYSYVITSVQGGRAVESRSWRLQDDRQGFAEEAILVQETT
jgi:proteasome lid subunit RPN8/RPN11